MADLEKYDRLKEILKSYESVAVAFRAVLTQRFFCMPPKMPLAKRSSQ